MKKLRVEPKMWMVFQHLCGYVARGERLPPMKRFAHEVGMPTHHSVTTVLRSLRRRGFITFTRLRYDLVVTAP